MKPRIEAFPSILSQENFISCPNCTRPVSSMSPTCEKCGLTIGAEGIDELADIEEQNKMALRDALMLRSTAVMSIAGTLLGYWCYRLFPEGLLFLVFIFPASFAIFWFQVIRWHFRHSRITSPNDYFTRALKEKNTAIGTFLCLISGLAIYLFVNW